MRKQIQVKWHFSEVLFLFSCTLPEIQALCSFNYFQAPQLPCRHLVLLYYIQESKTTPKEWSRIQSNTPYWLLAKDVRKDLWISNERNILQLFIFKANKQNEY